MPAQIHVSRFDGCPRQELDRYLDSSKDAGPYQAVAWLKAIEKAYGHEGWVISARQKGEICGALLLVRIKIPFMRSQMVSLPFCDYGGVIADDNVIKDQLCAAAKDLKSRKRLSSLQIRSRIASGAPDAWREGEKVRMVLALPDSSEKLFESFKPKLRSQIRKAKKNGLHCNVGSGEDLLLPFYHVFCDNMRRLGSPVHSLSFFHALKSEYGEKMLVAIVNLDGQPIGAGIVLCGHGEACIPWASTLAKYNHLAPNMLLYWSLLERTCDSGFTAFDFGRSSFGEGTFLFKKQWGAQPEPLSWEEIGKKPDLEKKPEASSEFKSKISRLVIAAWQRLPLDLANWLGPKIRRYISL